MAKLSKQELEDLIDSSMNGLKTAKILLHLDPPREEGLVHTALEDVALKVQKIALEYCTEE